MAKPTHLTDLKMDDKLNKLLLPMRKLYIIKQRFLFEKSDPPERGYHYSKQNSLLIVKLTTVL
jgi:hypothetical protein